jgi:hypothetical protein
VTRDRTLLVVSNLYFLEVIANRELKLAFIDSNITGNF